MTVAFDEGIPGRFSSFTVAAPYNEKGMHMAKETCTQTSLGYEGEACLEDHELHQSNELSFSLSSNSAIRVEIADVDGEESFNLTTTALRRCKRQVLRPYWRLLVFIGWRALGRESINSNNCRWQMLNAIYPIFIILLLLYTYVYQIIACQWKLDVVKDTKIIPVTTTAPHTTMANHSNATATLVWIDDTWTLEPAHFVPPKNTSQFPPDPPQEACKHIITTYVIPNILHFAAYIMGLVYFRIRDTEHLYALMEKVFLQASPLQGRVASQQKVIRKLRLFLFGGGLWVLMTLGLQGIYMWAFNFPSLAFFVLTGEVLRIVLLTIEMLGILVMNSVNLAVIINYVTHCEMILFYIQGITLRIQEKSVDLRTAMKDIFILRKNISLLNGPVANMMSLVSVILAELVIIGISILILNQNDLVQVWLYRGLFPAVWFVPLLFPFVQAARVNALSRRFIKLAMEARVFGYKNSSQLDLDSFILFVSNTKMRAKLFHIPVVPAFLICTLVISGFVVLILFQSGVIGSSRSYLF